MGTRAAQVIFMLGVLAGGAYLVISNADSWGDWVVFGVLISVRECEGKQGQLAGAGRPGASRSP